MNKTEIKVLQLSNGSLLVEEHSPVFDEPGLTKIPVSWHPALLAALLEDAGAGKPTNEFHLLCPRCKEPNFPPITRRRKNEY